MSSTKQTKSNVHMVSMRELRGPEQGATAKLTKYVAARVSLIGYPVGAIAIAGVLTALFDYDWSWLLVGGIGVCEYGAVRLLRRIGWLRTKSAASVTMRMSRGDRQEQIRDLHKRFVDECEASENNWTVIAGKVVEPMIELLAELETQCDGLAQDLADEVDHFGERVSLRYSRCAKAAGRLQKKVRALKSRLDYSMEHLIQRRTRLCDSMVASAMTFEDALQRYESLVEIWNQMVCTMGDVENLLKDNAPPDVGADTIEDVERWLADTSACVDTLQEVEWLNTLIPRVAARR